MSDLRGGLERLCERAEVAPDAFERLERARRRHERNRRITAGFVALLVAIAGSLVAFSAFRGSGGQVAGASGGAAVTTPAPAGPADVAEFTCDGSGAIAPASVTVDAQADGVHIAVTNSGSERVSFTVGSLDPERHLVGGDGAEPGERKETVWQLPPGDATVSCNQVSAGGTDTSPTADVRVEDPTGSYVPVGMDCPMSSQISDYVEGAVGIEGDPVEVARQHLSGLEFDDLVERGGYPDSDPPVVRVVRNGDVVASATFLSDGQGGWLIETLDVCVDVLIGWSNEVTGVSGPMGQPSNGWDALCTSARAGGGNNLHNGDDLHVTGQDVAFDTRCLIAPARKRLKLLFSNLDGGVPRNLSVYPLTPYLRECIVTGTSPESAGDLGHPSFEGDLITGVDEILYELGRFGPGEYYFQDDVHPFANGVLIVE